MEGGKRINNGWTGIWIEKQKINIIEYIKNNIYKNKIILFNINIFYIYVLIFIILILLFIIFLNIIFGNFILISIAPPYILNSIQIFLDNFGTANLFRKKSIHIFFLELQIYYIPIFQYFLTILIPIHY